jgi:hypothetical protein
MYPSTVHLVHLHKERCCNLMVDSTMAVSPNGERRCKVSIWYSTVHWERCCNLMVDTTMAVSQNGERRYKVFVGYIYHIEVPYTVKFAATVAVLHNSASST